MTDKAIDPTGVLPLMGQTNLAKKLAVGFKDKHMHVQGIGWHHWDGTRWAYDEGEVKIRQAILRVIENVMWPMAFNNPAAQADVKALMSNQGQKGALAIAAVLPEFAVNVSELDADPYLLNVANGTIDLRTGELRPHDPADRITKVTRGAHDPAADRSEWEAFLERIIPDPEVRAYVQRVIGVGLLGVVLEHILPIAIGTKGGNGKGTFYTSVLHALGDYGSAAESDLFMTIKTNANSASPAIVSLRGCRFVVCSETEEGAPLAAALMKRLTGGDPIKARALHQMPIEFEPSHTAWMVTNHLPKVKAADSALWRRIRVIPFQVDIPEEEQDKTLGERLKLSADVILSWALEGYRDYAENEMQAPEAVLLATKQYRADSDDFGRFMNDRLDRSDPKARTVRSSLWDAWVAWCRVEDVQTGSQGDYYKEMDKHFTAVKVRGVRYFAGVQIVKDTDEDAVYLAEEVAE